MKARVAELYRAQLAEDEPAKRALVLPQIINCGLIISEDDDGIQHDEPPLQIIAWKIRNIEFDMNSYDSVHELCPGQPVHATAGATVTIQQTEREDGEEASTGELYVPWLYVDGTWYWLIDVD